MGVQVPPLSKGKKHRIVINLTGKLAKRDADALKRALNDVLERYRKKCGKVTPSAPKQGPRRGW